MATQFKACAVEGCNRKVRGTREWCHKHDRRWKRHGDPLGGRAFDGDAMAWAMNVAANHSGDDCLIWPFGRDTNGYGKIWVDGKGVRAHRFVCEVVHGSAPTPQHQAAHSCGKGHEGCCGANHISWKTEVENAADKMAHGTALLGEKNPLAKLSLSDVMEIRRRLSDGEMQTAIASDFGVTKQAIWSIKAGRSWSLRNFHGEHRR